MARWQALDHGPHHKHRQVKRRALDLPEIVIAMEVGHVIEPLAQLDEGIHLTLGDLDVGVGLPRAVHNQQASLQSFGIVDRRGFAISLGISLRRRHKDLLEPRDVESWQRLGTRSEPM